MPYLAHDHPGDLRLRLPSGAWRVTMAVIALFLTASFAAALPMVLVMEDEAPSEAVQLIAVVLYTALTAGASLVIVLTVVRFRRRNGRCTPLGFTAHGVWATTGSTPFQHTYGRAAFIPWACVERLEWSAGLLGGRCAVVAADFLPYADLILPSRRVYAFVRPGRARRARVERLVAELSGGRFPPMP